MTLHEHIQANPNESLEATVAWWINELTQEKGSFPMPDISMCNSEDCTRKTTCKRSQASGTVPGEWQSWSGFNHKTCQNYWPVDRKKAHAADIMSGKA